MKKQQRNFFYSKVMGLALMMTMFQAGPLIAAERIFLSFKFLERSIPVQDLDRYAKDGLVSQELAPYLGFFDQEQQQQLRASLQERLDVNAVAAAQFLYTPAGDALIKRIQRVVRTKSGQGSYFAIRSALITAATAPEGLTALSVLRYFPNAGIKVDLTSALDMLNQVQQVVKTSQNAVSAVIQQSQAEPQANSLNSWSLSRPGRYPWERITLDDLKDDSQKRMTYTGRTRDLAADVYLPTTPSAQPYPVIVISHGFNSDRTTYAYLARHLVSHGYVVLVPEHTGSNVARIAELFQGRAQDAVDPTEFIDRPLDVTYLLDKLEQLTQSDPRFQKRLALDKVGIIGHSYGGYTALALAGASPNFTQLRQDCDTLLDTTLNFSLLLQCHALQAPKEDITLADSRIQSVIAINQIGSSIFGKQGYGQIKVPVMIISGTMDAIAPALPEQIQPFTWLTTADKQLVLMNNGTHLSTENTANESGSELPEISPLKGPRPDLARYYARALSIAFFGHYNLGKEEFASFLTSSYAAQLSRRPLTLHLTSTLSLESLNPEESTDSTQEAGNSPELVDSNQETRNSEEPAYSEQDP